MNATPDWAIRLEQKLDALLERITPPKSGAYTLSEAAELLGISHRTIRRRAEEGRILLIRDGRRVLIAAAEVERYRQRLAARSRRAVP